MVKITRTRFNQFLEEHGKVIHCGYHAYECPKGMWYENAHETIVRRNPNQITCCDSLAEKFVLTFPRFKGDPVLLLLKEKDAMIMYILTHLVEDKSVNNCSQQACFEFNNCNGNGC